MKILIAALSACLLASPSQKYEKPVNVDLESNQPNKAINVVTNLSESPFIYVKDGPVTYDELKYYAMYHCKNNKEPSISIIETLIDVEKSFNPPPEMRGMILSAACMESGFNPRAKGDRKFSRDKKTPMAVGILQLWPIYEKMFPGMDRTNPKESAVAWMKHIVKKIPKVKRQCKYKTQKRIWLAAWVTGIRYKKPGGRCKERPKHYRLLRKWHREIKRDRQEMHYCADRDGCGC